MFSPQGRALNTKTNSGTASSVAYTTTFWLNRVSPQDGELREAGEWTAGRRSTEGRTSTSP
jgi:hypothetical protein